MSGAGQLAPAERPRPEAAQSPPPDASRAGRTDGTRGTRAGEKGRRSQGNARPPAINP